MTDKIDWAGFDGWTDADLAPFELEGCEVVMTCAACPEQYEVFGPSGGQIGYLRLRHGHFRADYPDCGGDTVYEADLPDCAGCFSPEERKIHLPAAVKALVERHKNLV